MSEIRSKKHLEETALTFNGTASAAAASKGTCGAFAQEDGSVKIRVSAGSAQTVNAVYVGGTISLTPVGEGIWEGVIPYESVYEGPVGLTLYLDGAPLMSPDLPIFWTDDRPCNYVELTGGDDAFFALEGIPHGALRRELFYSEVMNGYERCIVYTPPGYAVSSCDYPVLYLLNGTGDNELAWEYCGRMAETTDRLLSEGKAVPYIVVMCNGMLRTGGRIERFLDLGFETMLVNECRPYIEAHYRVKTDRANRGIAGLSMGAYTTNDITWHHPELFSYVGQFTASMVREPVWTAYERPFASALKGLTREEMDDYFQVFFRSTTPAEDHFEFFMADDAIYHHYGLDDAKCYRRVVYPATTSKWMSWRKGYYDFAQLVFQ